MMKVKLRDFANRTEAEILRWLGTRIKVEVTDDHGEVIITDTQALMQTWQGLIVHRHYDHIPYSIKEVIPSNKVEKREIVYNDDEYTTPINFFLEEIMQNMHDPNEIDHIKIMIFIWQTKLNNLLSVMSERYVLSATAECVDELMQDKGIEDIKHRVMTGEITIDDGEKEFSVYMKEAESLNFNTFALLARTGGVAVNQAYQMTIVRGACFDLNNKIFPNAVMSAYAEGIVDPADAMAEGKGAGKSLITNGRALKDAEWFHRKTHLFMAPLDTIDYLTDCGTELTIPIKIDDREIAKACIGKYMVDEEGKLKLLTRETIRKIKTGETINIRSVAFCKSHDPAKPCGICYGQMKTAIPYNVMMQRSANIGMYSGTTLCNPIGQRMLSTKHFLRNTITQRYTVRMLDLSVINSDGDNIFLNKGLDKPGTKVVLPKVMARELSDLRSLDSLDSVSSDKLSYFDSVIFKHQEEDPMTGGVTTVQKSVNTVVSSRSARLSNDFLEYILDQGWEQEDKNFISISLGDWNIKAPLFILPHMHEDLDVHRRKIESFLSYTSRNNAWMKREVTPQIFGETLVEFWQLVNQKFKGNNIIHTELMLYAGTAKNPEQGFYGLSNGNGTKYFASLSSCINNRGAGTLLIFERQQSVFSDYKTYLVKERQPSILEGYWQMGVS